MKKIRIPNADGELIEVEVTEEIYDVFVYDKYKEEQRERYRNTYLQDYMDRDILEDSVVLSKDDLNDILDDVALMEKINIILEKCTDTQKRRFFLRFFEEKTYMEIAHIEKVNYKAVYKPIQQVRKKFKVFFKKGS